MFKKTIYDKKTIYGEKTIYVQKKTHLRKKNRKVTKFLQQNQSFYHLYLCNLIEQTFYI